MTPVGHHLRPLSPWWRHSVILVMIAGFTVLGVVTALTYTNAPPIPRRVLDPNGAVLFTKADVERGQEVFFKYDLMEHGTLWGHGAYLGPDYTADYLHREALTARDTLAVAAFQRSFDQLPAGQRAAVAARVEQELKLNRYDVATGDLRFSAGETAAFNHLASYWREFFSTKDRAPGLPPGFIKNPHELQALNAYLAWATWATVTNRPGKSYTYTNNWPYEPLVGNSPSSQAYVWSAASLLVLLVGLGLVLLVFGKFHFLGWGGDETESQDLPALPTAWALTPSQWATGKYFGIVALLFFLQVLAGGALAHYRVEPYAFYGFTALVKFLPFNLGFVPK